MKLSLTIIIIALLLGSSAFSQDIKITGTISESENNQSLQYVNIALYSLPDSAFVTGSITNQSGNFELSTSKKGHFYVVADFVGYKKQYFNSIVIDESTSVLDMGTLSISPQVIGLNQVEVTGERSMVSYYLDKKVITVGSNIAAQSGTAIDVLAQTSSVQTDLEGNVTIKGNSSFTVMVDGKQSPLEGSEALNQIPSSIIDRIEIITNPSVKYDPDGTGGIINVITKKSGANTKSLNINSSIGTGPVYSGDVNIGFNYKKISVQTGISYNHREFQAVHKTYRETYISPDTTLFLTTDGLGRRNFENLSIRTNINYDITDKNTVSFGVNHTNFKFGRSEYAKNFLIDTIGETFSITNDDFEVKPAFWELNVGDKLIFNKPEHNLDIKFYYQIVDRSSKDYLYKFYSGTDWSEDSLSQAKTYTEQGGERTNYRFELNYSVPLGFNTTLESGYSYRNAQASNIHHRYEGTDLTSDWTELNDFLYHADFSDIIHGVYALGTTKLGLIDMNYGLRMEYTERIIEVTEYNSSYNFIQYDWFPSAAISREWENGHKVSLSYSKRVNRPRDWNLNPFKLPTDGFSSQVGNPELEPEYIHALELNYQKVISNSTLSAELFYRNTINAITRNHYIDEKGVYITTWDNLGAEESSGIDLSGDIKFANWLTVAPVLSGYYFKITDGEGDDKVETDNFSYQGKLTTFITLPTKTRIQLNANFEGPEVHVDGEEKGMWFAGFAIQQAFFERKLSLTFKLDDIFMTHRHDFTSLGNNYMSDNKFYRNIYPVTFSLIYRLNGQKGDKKKRNGYEENNGGGEDMDMGM